MPFVFPVENFKIDKQIVSGKGDHLLLKIVIGYYISRWYNAITLKNSLVFGIRVTYFICNNTNKFLLT